MKARFYSTGYDFLYSALININSATYANYQGIVVNSLDSRRTTSFWTQAETSSAPLTVTAITAVIESNLATITTNQIEGSKSVARAQEALNKRTEHYVFLIYEGADVVKEKSAQTNMPPVRSFGSLEPRTVTFGMIVENGLPHMEDPEKDPIKVTIQDLANKKLQFRYQDVGQINGFQL